MNSSSQLSFSFVIPVLNGEKHLRRCLEHIIREMSPEDELIVVDNGSTDETLSIVRQFEQVTLLEHPKLTIAALRNRGAATAKGEILAFVDSDCLVAPGWRVAAIEVLVRPDVSVTGAVYDLPENPAWVEAAWWSARKTTASETHVLFGGNLLIKKDTFAAVNGFDESLITDEDSELCLRLQAAGCHLWEEPAIRVVHLGNAKTIGQFYRQIRWHSTSMLRTMFSQRFDKPMVLTLLFVLSILFAIAGLIWPGATCFSPWLLLLLPLIAPLISAVYRVVQKGNFGFFFQLWLLYLIYYAARTIVLIKAICGRRSTRPE